ncbi:putative F-box protein At3g23420 [Capsella rubella]|nr:putative F-box protein At3g23420 [Capsella rubella]
MVMDFRVSLLSVSFNNNVESCIKREGQVISLDGSNQLKVLQNFHCEGLLLCSLVETATLVVWNPYLGQTRWIETSHDYRVYALGYEKVSKSCCNYKILRFGYYNIYDFNSDSSFGNYNIYDFNSDSWRVLYISEYHHLEVNLDRDLGVSLEGNTYWIASDYYEAETPVFLLCFDFTREVFATSIPLPFKRLRYEYVVALSSVREEQLAVLLQRWDLQKLEIWITNKVEPNTVSWGNKFSVEVNMSFLNAFRIPSTRFFINEKKKCVVAFDKHDDNGLMSETRNVACIVGVDGPLEEVELAEPTIYAYGFPFVCSYVPSLVQLH